MKHGQNQHGQITYEYRKWQNLKYEKKLCKKWEDSFEEYYKYTGKRPSENSVPLRTNINMKFSINNFYWGHPRDRFFKDLKGKKFGSWIVEEKDYDNKKVCWFCICDCGFKASISQVNLTNKISTKCKSCAMKGKVSKHGKSRTSEYTTWSSMKERCYNKNNKNYIHYGGRGINVCDSWKKSFENFVKDMGKKPGKEYSLDRIDNNGDYNKENCRWATKKTQIKNRRKMSELQKEIDDLKVELQTFKIEIEP